MSDDPLTEVAKRIEEQTHEIRRLQSTVIWSVLIGTGAILLALFFPPLLWYLLAVAAVFALGAGIVSWGSSIGKARIEGKRAGGLAFIILGVILAVASFWGLHL